MDKVKLAELEQLNETYYAGRATDILYRCSLLSPFLRDISSNDEEVINLFRDWLDICDEFQVELIESLIIYYGEGTICGAPFRLAEIYPEYCEQMVDFLLGKTTWTGTKEETEAAVAHSKHFTAQVLNHLLTK